MALQLGHLANSLIFISLLISCKLVFCADIAYHEEQQASKLNKSSYDQGHRQIACPPWKYHKYNNSSCVCGPSVSNVVECKEDQSTVYLLSCHCMSYKESGDHDTVVMGTCPFLCTNYFYTEIETDTNLSNICNSDTQQNRQGQMCGKCRVYIDGHCMHFGVIILYLYYAASYIKNRNP